MKKTKQCLNCAADLKGGRSDRKYCDPQCRASHHNKIRRTNEQSVQTINAILKNNWKILKHLNPVGHSTIRISEMEERGYNFNYFTNVYKGKFGRFYYFCYDYGFSEVDKSKVPKVNIVNWQDYMNDYKLPIGKNKKSSFQKDQDER